MYGFEYYSQANLTNKKNDGFTFKQTEEIKNSKSTKPISFNTDESDVTEQLAVKLQHLTKCPDYLTQKEFFTITNQADVSRTSYSTQGSLTATLSSNKSTSSCASKYYTDDFMLLSEFSEIEGPKPLLTIPTDGGTAFNKNEYSLHLMCVDFHSHLRPASSEIHDQTQGIDSQQCYAPNTSKFSLSKDTTIINYYDSSSSVAACVHHFTLYDLEARGFVRPFCLAYISYDKLKPVIYFEQIRQKFNEITNLFKKSNYNLFKLEIEQQLADLKYTRELFVKWSTKHEDDSDNDPLNKQRNELAACHNLNQNDCQRLTSSSSNIILQLKTIDTLSNELENVLSVINAELKSKNWIIKNMRDSCQNLASNDGEIKSPKQRSMTYPTDDKLKQKQLFNSLKKPKLFVNILIGVTNKKSMEINPKNPDEDCTTEQSTGGIDFHNLNHSHQHKTMKRLHQLSINTAKAAINEMRLMHSYFSTPYYLLKFRDINKMKANATIQETGNGNLSHFWSILFGNSVIDDFSTNIDSINLNKYSLIKKHNSGMNFLLENLDKQRLCSHSSEHNSIKNSQNNEERQHERSNSPGEESCYNDAENFDQIGAINNDNEVLSDLVYTVKPLIKTEMRQNSAFGTTPISLKYLENFFNETQEKMNTTNGFEKNDSEDTEFFETISEYECEISSSANEYDFVNSLIDQRENSYTIKPIQTHHLPIGYSLAHNSQSKVYAAFNRCKDNPSLTDTLIDMIKFNFEETLLNLSNQYTEFFPHLLYSILKGRPVICISRYCQDQPNLISIVETLSNFVPNSFHNLNELVTNVDNMEVPKLTSSPCHLKFNLKDPLQNGEKKHKLMAIYERQPIKLNDLKYCKMFGLTLLITKDNQCCSADCNSNKSFNRRSMFAHKHKHYHASKHHDDTDLVLKFIPITVRNYVSIFDLDKGTFVGPRYNGSHLINALQKGRHLKQDSIFFLYLMNHLIKYYLRIAFIFHYSILFEEEFQMKKRLDSYSRQSISSTSTSIRERTSSLRNNSCYNAKRERIMRYFSSNNKNNSSQSNTSLSASRDLLGFLNFSKSRRSSKVSSSVNSSFLSINELNNQLSLTKNTSQLGRPFNAQNDNLELLKILLSALHNNTHKSDFSQSDFIIVNNLLKTMEIKQIYLYNLAMQKKFLKEHKEKNDYSNSPRIQNYNIQYAQIPYPLLVDFEEIMVFHSKKN